MSHNTVFVYNHPERPMESFFEYIVPSSLPAPLVGQSVTVRIPFRVDDNGIDVLCKVNAEVVEVSNDYTEGSVVVHLDDLYELERA